MKSLYHIIYSFFTQNKYPIVLSLLILACLYPLSLFIYIPKWDNINGYLPYRYFISDYVWNGHLPLWNPFQRLGLPGYSDLQSGCWNPIVWIIMLFGKYTINSLIVELLSCYVLAGIGMFKLCRFIFGSPKTAFILGLSYALSGFMVGSSQLMVFLIAVTWFPWIVYGLLRFFASYQFKYQLLTALFMALYITAASPAYTIILGYIVVGIFMYHLIVKRSNGKEIRNIVVGGSTMLVVLVVLMLPYINAFLEFSPYFNRVDKLAYNAFLLDNPFTPVSYISFLFPFTVIANTDIFNITDLSLRDGYMGIIGLAFFISAFFSKLNTTKIILLISLFVSLVLAAGDETFVFKFLYHLPGFGIFRHPSMFRAFSIFCMLLLAGYEVKNVLENGWSKHHKIICSALLMVSIASGVYAFTQSSLKDVTTLISHVFQYVEFSKSTFSTHLLLNSIFIILLILLTFLFNRWVKIPLFYLLSGVAVLDLGIHTRFTTPTTICYHFERAEVSHYFKNLPNNIQQKDAHIPLKRLDEKQGLMYTNGIWQNLSTFNKTLSYVGVNPMRFKDFDVAKDNGVLELNIQNEILFFPSKYKTKNDTVQKGLLWGVKSTPPITKEKTSLDQVEVGYNQFNAQITNAASEDQWFVLNQNYHHLWKAYYNNQPLEVQKVNELIMGVQIPKNSKGNLHFVFESPRTIYAFIISVIGYLFILVWMVRNRFIITDKNE